MTGKGSAVRRRDRAVLARHGSTFHLAGRLLGASTFDRAAGLYAACRAVDDLADEHPDPEGARDILVALLGDLRAPPRVSDHARTELGRKLLELRVDPCAAAVLVETVLSDLDLPVGIADEAALLRYAYGAAGTVGIMMCDVLAVAAPAARRHAVSLGIAMQLTNIARDVGEDAARGRIYLPAAWLWDGVSPGSLLRGDPELSFPAVRRLLALAEGYYADGIAGLRFLDRRSALAVSVAASLYRAIGHDILRRGPVPLSAPRRRVATTIRVALVVRGVLAGWPVRGGRVRRRVSRLI
ncbi:MAG: squalene/phytoene synthase family protein [Gluconacetobacter diazotrophicus]|nr:squalene/phytoene synthase family protein [Gluconacetobacter diazotrophicus]